MRARMTVVLTSALVLSLLPALPAPASPVSTMDAIANGPEPPASALAEDERDAYIGTGWSSSADLAWTTSGDATGFHVLVAEAADGYAWRTVASLSEPGFDADMWIGNVCLTASGERMVVVYAPRTFTNRPDLSARGGFTAVVDVATGAVTKLPVTSTLAYYSPGCGAGETAVVSQATDDASDGPARTRLISVDTARGSLGKPVVVDGQLTSVLPAGKGFRAAVGDSVVSVSPTGRVDRIASTDGVPFRLVADDAGGVVWHERSGADGVAVKRLAPDGAVSTLASGALGQVRAVPGGDGKVFLTGAPAEVSALPETMARLDVPVDAKVSTRGEAAVTATGWIGGEDPRLVVADPDVPRPVWISVRSLVTGKDLEFGVAPAPTTEDAPLSVGNPSTSSLATSSTVETGRWCSVPRNDPDFMVLQPRPRQVEWAVDQAVTNSLYVQRPADWMGLGMAAYQPQSMFPPIALDGGGRVHSQVMLGIAAQESNMWQATRLASPGMTGNPLIGNYYGQDKDEEDSDSFWNIDFSKADCGYGVTQVTDGMRLAGHEKPGETALPWAKQQAVAADFAANVAAGLRILQAKWNETRRAGLVVGEGRASGLENWYFALWAYNSGFHPLSEAPANNGAWGLGWANNPVNPHYPADRSPFMERSYADAAHPQDWPYQEKVIGFAGHPPEFVDEAQPDQVTLVAGFRPAWWVTLADRVNAKAPNETFCTAAIACHPGGSYDPPPGDDEPWLKSACAHKDAGGAYDLKCWWHGSTTWKKDRIDPVNGAPISTTGFEVLRFDPGYAYQPNGTSFAPKCSTELPTGVKVIDDVPEGSPQNRPNCAPDFAEAGAFTLAAPEDETGGHRALADLHQLGSGYNSHFWFAHTRDGDHDRDGTMRLTGNWRFADAMHGWGRVFVHIPNVAAHTQQARYEIDLGDGFGSAGEERVIQQRIRSNEWVALGAFEFDGSPQIRLSNFTHDGTGDEDVVWDAVAIQPLPGKPAHQIVSLGDSLSSGEGAAEYYPETDFKLTIGEQELYQNACHRSRNAWSRQMTVPGRTVTVGAAADARDVNVDHHLLACTGARTDNVLPYHTVPDGQDEPENAFGRDGSGGGGGNNSEVSQLDRGFLNTDTTLVTISIGVNDARFTKILTSCVASVLDTCANDRIADADAPNGAYLPKLIDEKVGPSIELVLAQIHQRAPNAEILLTGYPRLFDAAMSQVCPVLQTASRLWLNAMSARLNTRMKLAADRAGNADIPVRFADPSATFTRHGACRSDDDEEWMHEIVVDRTDGELTKPHELDGASQQSFHPNATGAAAYGGFVGGLFGVLRGGCRGVTCDGWQPAMLGCTADKDLQATYDDFIPGGVSMELYSSASCGAAWAEFEVFGNPGTYQSWVRVDTTFDSVDYVQSNGFEDVTGTEGMTPMVPVDVSEIWWAVDTCFIYRMDAGGELHEICDPQGV